MVVATQTQFDERNPRYYTCCCCHVRTGVIVISIIEIVLEALGIISVVFTPAISEATSTSFMGNNESPVPNVTYASPTMSYVNVKWSVPVHAIIMVVCAVLAILGMRGIKPAFLIPHIVMQVITLVILLVSILCLIILGIILGPAVIIIIIIIIPGLALPFTVWFLVVFVRGYKYLKDKREFLVKNQNSFVTGSVPMTAYNPISVYAGGQQASGQPNYAQIGYAKVP